MVMSFFLAFGVTKMLQRMSPFLALFDRRGGSPVWSRSGEQRTWGCHRKSAVPDPFRHFGPLNCCCAK
jgi:hypothetical protein